jgi:hypothetical protein
MITGVMGFLAALPKLLDLISRLGQIIQSAQAQAWINELESAISQTEKASTPDDFKSAAKNLVGVIGSLSR